jgi:cytochrome c-type biogenesis protein CcmH
MVVLVLTIFAGLALAAAAFAAWPVLRGKRDAGGFILAAAIACAVVGIGLGLYLVLGAPELALRALTGPGDQDWKGQVARLVDNARAHPDDEKAWAMLGLGYMTVGDGDDAAAAFRRARAVAPAAQQADLLSHEGRALVMADGGQVGPQAEDVFDEVLRRDPRDPAARFYLGFAYAARRDNAHALALWQSLLADTPPGAELHKMLVDRIAMLTAASGARPDIGAMVSGLAARLRAQPNDEDGWQRLIRAYVVMGDDAKARQALADGRAAMKANAKAQAALGAEATQLGLEK